MSYIASFGIDMGFRDRAAERTRARPHVSFAPASTDGTGYFQCHTAPTGTTTPAHNENTGSSHWACGVNTTQSNDTFVVCPSKMAHKTHIMGYFTDPLPPHTHMYTQITAFRSSKQACSIVSCHEFTPMCVAVLTAQRVSLAR